MKIRSLKKFQVELSTNRSEQSKAFEILVLLNREEELLLLRTITLD